MVHLRGQILKGDHSGVEEWHKRWLERKGKNVIPAGISVVEREAEETDGDGDSTDEEEDVEMEDAPPATGSGGGVKEKPEPIVDEDGFELVQKRRR